MPTLLLMTLGLPLGLPALFGLRSVRRGCGESR